MKSTEIWLYGFSGIALGISFPAGASLQFLYLWYTSYLSIYLPTSFVISGNQLCHLPSSSVLFYWDVVVQSYYFPSEFSFWYVYPSFITILSSIFHSLSFNIFIPTLFNSSTAFTTFSSLSCAFLIFSFRFSFSIIVSALLIYSSFINF